MVSVVRRRKGGGHYYYLVYHSGKNRHERYLGMRVPAEIDSVKRKFEWDMYKKENAALLEAIHARYSGHVTDTDKKIIRSENHGFKIHHIYSTQRIEGSTMTLGQTRNLLEYNMSPKDTAPEHVIEAMQMEKVFDEMLSAKQDVTKQLVLRWHDILFAKTDTNNAGSFRRADVAPYGEKTEYALWPDVIPEMERLLRWYHKNRELNPVMTAAILHNRFELIHPFIDGNGRIGRMLMLLILRKGGYPMMNIRPREKSAYIKKLEGTQTRGDCMIFLKWFVSKYLRDNKRYLSEPRTVKARARMPSVLQAEA